MMIVLNREELARLLLNFSIPQRELEVEEFQIDSQFKPRRH